MERFDAIVVGAGPAGSTTARSLAERGASVLLLDRVSFPRDKPCGGGVTIRAARQLPFPLDAVVENVVDRIEVRLRLGRSWERVRARPLALMTRRSALDAFLAERAAAAGARFRDGVRVTDVAVAPERVVVRAGRDAFSADAVVGADGANGIVARSLGLCDRPAYGVALEGNVSHANVRPGRYARRIVFELGLVGGGYGWIFPKRDHVNVGVGGWASEGPRLRGHLATLCRAHGLEPGDVRDVGGHRLPVRRRGARLARGRALVVGDAAGLVDPFAGDGIYEAFVSGVVAAGCVGDLLAGRVPDLEPYGARLDGVLQVPTARAWTAKAALELLPGLMFEIARAERVQSALERLVRGDERPSSSAFSHVVGSAVARATLGAGALVHALALRSDHRYPVSDATSGSRG